MSKKKSLLSLEMEAAAATPDAQEQKKRNPNQRHRPQNAKKNSSKTAPVKDNTNKGKKKPVTVDKKQEDKKVEEKAEENEEGEEDHDQICFICAEPVATFAVLSCNHRTCHLCALRLRCLYKTRNCAYCKTEQNVVIFTKDANKSFKDFTPEDTPFADETLDARFEDKQTQQDTTLLLQYNCPDPDCNVACDNGWSELKRHVKKAHDRMLCDICTQFKKIFPHEHTLYTSTQLHKHYKLQTNDETGFSGHPECRFCKTSYYGSDELYEHCRDKHEQCHICVRRGHRHNYYANYDSLESHFKSDHYLCTYRDCLDKKFVVFDNELDLIAHEVQDHNADSRKLRIHSEYAKNQHRQNDGQGRKDKPRPTENAQQEAASTEQTRHEFPSLRNAPRSSEGAQPATAGPKSKGKSIQKPAGFGSLTSADNWPRLGNRGPGTAAATTSTAAETSSTAAGDQSTLSLHTSFLQNAREMLRSEAKVEKFRALTTAYRNNIIDVDTFVNEIVDLCDKDKQTTSKILKGVENLIDNEEKKWEVSRSWRTAQTAQQEFPALASTFGKDSRSEGRGTSSRVMVIKSGNTRSGGTRTTGKSKAGVWDRVASAAAHTTKNNGSPSHSRSNSPPRMTFPTIRSSQNVAAWTGNNKNNNSSARDGKSRVNTDFPSLPTTTTPKHSSILALRHAKSNGMINAWSERDNENELGAEDTAPAQTSGKKGKKKNKQILFRVGL